MSDSSINRRQFMQRSAVGLSALSAVGLLEACGNSGGATGTSALSGGRPPAGPVGTFRRSYALEVDTLDPAVSIAGGLPIIASIYEGLVRFNDDWTQLIPALATSWTQSDDGREWEFILREGVTFHDGEPFDAAAVKAGFDYLKAKKGFAGTLLPDWDSVDTSDPHRIHFALKQPCGDFVRNQSFLKIMSPKLIKAGGSAPDRAPSGTGAFKFANRAPGRSVTLSANPHYWGRGPYFEQVDWLLMPDPTARLNALSSRQIDQTNVISPETVAQFNGSGYQVLVRDKPFRIYYLRFMMTNPNVADKRIRQAMAYAIDRETIIKRLLEGKGTLATSVMPQGIYGHADAEPQYPYDPDRARALLKEAGVSNPTVRMAVVPAATIRGQDSMEAILGYLKDVGFNATLDVEDVAVVAREEAKPHPRWDVYFDGHSWLTGGPVIFSINLIQALTRYNPKALQDLNTKQQNMADGPERLQVLAAMQNLIQANLPYIPLWLPYEIDAQTADIRGYAVPPDDISYHYAETFRAA